MTPIVHVQISDIVRYWKHPQLGNFRFTKEKRKCCQKLLPDIFDGTKCNESSVFPYFDELHGLESNVLRMVVNGNRKSLSASIRHLGCAAFVQDLIDLLNQDAPFALALSKDDCHNNEVQTTTPRKSLFDNLLRLVTTSVPAVRADFPVFTQIHLEPDTPSGRGTEAYQQLRNTVQKLLLEGSVPALTYAVMIYVLAGWLQWRVEDIPWLWDWSQIRPYLSQITPRITPKNAAEHIVFEDTSYMHKYHAYLFRSTRIGLFEQGCLTIAPEPPFSAQVTLELRYQSGDDPNHFQYRKFRGIPMLAQKDSIVYANLTEENGSLAHLYFAYQPFNANMYYRTAFLVRKDPDTPIPMQQKLVLTHRPLQEWEKPYIEGILSDCGDLIVLTPGMIESFLIKFRDENYYPWMPFFRAEVLPLIRETICVTQIFNCQLIHSHFLGALTELQILQITLALKSIPVPGFERQNRFSFCQSNPHTHALFRDIAPD